jgi:hypothetical protein
MISQMKRIEVRNKCHAAAATVTLSQCDCFNVSIFRSWTSYVILSAAAAAAFSYSIIPPIIVITPTVAVTVVSIV